MSNKLNYKLINILLSILIVCLLYSIKGLWINIFNKLISIILPFLIAFAISYSLYPYSRKLEDLGFPKFLAIGLIYILLIGFSIIMIIMVVPLFYEQVILFFSNISAVITDMSSFVKIDLGILKQAITDISINILSSIGAHISSGAINILSVSVDAVTNLIIVVAASIYFFCDMDKIRNKIRGKLKKSSFKVYEYVVMLDIELSNYFVGLFKTILIQFVEYTVVFLLIGHPNYLILGILAAITTIIPYFGALLVNILAIIIASVVSRDLFVLTILVCLICPVIDGYIIGPKVYSKTNKLPALINIFSVFAGGILGGFWGMIISLPVTIIIIASYKFFKMDINRGIVNFRKKI